MTAKVDTTSLMPNIPFSEKMINSFLGKMLVATLQTVLGSVILLLSFLVRETVDIFVLKYAIVIATGLLSGFSTRRFLKDKPQFLKFWVALIGISLSLGALQMISGGFMGINILTPPKQSPDWRGLSEFAISALGAWLVLTAFQAQPRSDVPSIKTSDSAQAALIMDKGSDRIVDQLRGWISKFSLPTLKLFDKKRNAKQKESVKIAKGKPVKLRTRKANQPKPAKVSVSRNVVVNSKPAVHVNKPHWAGMKTFWRKKPAVGLKFVGQQEHSCPYCLEPVLSNDPRGVKVCSTCHTHHHADCWGVAGACQVPHAQE